MSATETGSTITAPKAMEAAADAAVVSLLELNAAESTARALLGRANDAVALARQHASDNPESLQEAEYAAHDAQRTLSAIHSAQQSGNPAARAMAMQRLHLLGGIVQQASNAVAEEGAETSSTSRKNAMAANQAAKAAKPSTLASRLRNFVTGDDTHEIVVVGRRGGVAARDSDENDDEDSPARRRGGAKARRTNPGVAGLADWAGDKATDGWAAAAGAMGISKDSTRRGKTAIRAVTDGAAAISDGDADGAVNAANRVGVGTERSLKNMGVNATVARIAGESAEALTSNVGAASALTVGAVTGDSKKSSYSLTQLGKALERNTVGLFTDRTFLYQEVRDLMPELHRSKLSTYKGSDGKALLDKDKDGKIELDDVIALLKKHGTYDLKKLDKDKDGQLEARELGAALGHVIARERAAQGKK